MKDLIRCCDLCRLHFDDDDDDDGNMTEVLMTIMIPVVVMRLQGCVILTVEVFILINDFDIITRFYWTNTFEEFLSGRSLLFQVLLTRVAIILISI